jgi:hypothetical protein
VLLLELELAVLAPAPLLLLLLEPLLDDVPPEPPVPLVSSSLQADAETSTAVASQGIVAFLRMRMLGGLHCPTSMVTIRAHPSLDTSLLTAVPHV